MINKLFMILLIFTLLFSGCSHAEPIPFDGTSAKIYIEKQLEFGPRIPGSEGSLALKKYINNELESSGWIIENQYFVFDNTKLTNIIAKSSNNPPKVIFGTHYDTRAFSDNDPIILQQKEPVPGANDGASGTAVLLELGRILNTKDLDLWLVFFDAEDQGYIDNWEWSIGAQYFAKYLEFKPNSVIIIDMIGDSNLEIFRENNSSNALVDEIWKEAENLGFGQFFNQEYKYTIIDDHLPFIDKEISACVIIDLDYPYWHTTEDTLDKISEQSLEIIGNVLISWLSTQNSQ